MSEAPTVCRRCGSTELVPRRPLPASSIADADEVIVAAGYRCQVCVMVTMPDPSA